MTETTIIIIVAAVLATIAAAMIAYQQAKIQQANKEKEEAKDRYEAMMRQVKEENRIALDRMEQQYTDRMKRQAEIHADQLQALRQQQSEQLSAFRLQLENTTHTLLEQRQSELQHSNAQQMTDIVRPLREHLDQMHLELQRSREDSADKSARFEEQLKQMVDRTVNLGDVTQALTQAMKSNGKVQGDWGEHILETILENSGMQRGTHYETQVSVTTETGKVFRPDVVVHCPGGMRDIVIDSKVSLTAYTNYVTASDPAESEQFEKENYASLRKHVEELAAKDYSKLDKRNLPQVLMFVPNEGSYILALRHDPALGQWAFNKGVVILTPTNLMLTLELVCALWVNEKKEKNVEQILSTANTLYEKFCAFTDHMNGIRANLTRANDAYESALRYLTAGPGNVVRQIDKLKALGIKYNKSKNIDPALLEASEDEEEGY